VTDADGLWQGHCVASLSFALGEKCTTTGEF
jgi:hypothetical protein